MTKRELRFIIARIEAFEDKDISPIREDCELLALFVFDGMNERNDIEDDLRHRISNILHDRLNFCSY